VNYSIDNRQSTDKEFMIAIAILGCCISICTLLYWLNHDDQEVEKLRERNKFRMEYRARFGEYPDEYDEADDE
jgi:hypothetical protein